MMKIGKDENRIEGKALVKGAKVVKDENWIRIEWLKSSYLNRISSTNGGWDILYQDPEDDRLFEIIYTDSSEHGGGAPTLQGISKAEAMAKYNFGTS